MPEFAHFDLFDPEQPLSTGELERALRFVIAAEHEAVQLYRNIADACEGMDEQAATVLRDIADEEVVHVGEFSAVLERLVPGERELYDQGAKEVADMGKNESNGGRRVYNIAGREQKEPEMNSRVESIVNQLLGEGRIMLLTVGRRADDWDEVVASLAKAGWTDPEDWHLGNGLELIITNKTMRSQSERVAQILARHGYYVNKASAKRIADI
jgi:rubrerythrin